MMMYGSVIILENKSEMTRNKLLRKTFVSGINI